MKILGLDFTSAPSRSKPITCAVCELRDETLRFIELKLLSDFAQFSEIIDSPGPWIAGIDFPFGQSRIFIENMGWPKDWASYVRHAERLGPTGFEAALRSYSLHRSPGDKLHRRQTDKIARSLSPQKLDYVPVAKMFFKGAPRLIASGVTIPLLQQGDPNRVVVEAYPKLVAKAFISSTSYKSDNKKKQTPAKLDARQRLLRKIVSEELKPVYGFLASALLQLADDGGGDQLDALLCAVQAAWAWNKRTENFGAPADTDRLEGWIADPALINVK